MVMTVLREYQTAMGCLISEYGGTLERFAGDGIMVYFNDPQPCPNHAEQAVRMAIAMRHDVISLGKNGRSAAFPSGRESVLRPDMPRSV